MSEKNVLIVSSSPHLRSKENVRTIMLDVIIALIPALIAAVYIFGVRALSLTLVTVAAAVIAEFVSQKAMKKEVTIKDLSAVVTGMLLAFNLPVSFPYWMAAFGAVFAIVVVKQLFGGLGNNFMNPALAARAVLLASWPDKMGAFTKPFADNVASATPLAGKPVEMMDLFLGNIPGTIGEVSKVAILIGALYLLIKGVIHIRIPLVYILTTGVCLFLFKYDLEDTVMQLLSGGLLFGAFFMATDYATTPMTKKGQIIFAVGAGLLTAIIRVYGGYPEGVSYSILLMNVCTPLIDKYVKPKTFGGAK